jgi:hypothetical protein
MAMMEQFQAKKRKTKMMGQVLLDQMGNLERVGNDDRVLLKGNPANFRQVLQAIQLLRFIKRAMAMARSQIANWTLPSRARLLQGVLMGSRVDSRRRPEVHHPPLMVHLRQVLPQSSFLQPRELPLPLVHHWPISPERLLPYLQVRVPLGCHCPMAIHLREEPLMSQTLNLLRVCLPIDLNLVLWPAPHRLAGMEKGKLLQPTADRVQLDRLIWVFPVMGRLITLPKAPVHHWIDPRSPRWAYRTDQSSPPTLHRHQRKRNQKTDPQSPRTASVLLRMSLAVLCNRPVPEEAVHHRSRVALFLQPMAQNRLLMRPSRMVAERGLALPRKAGRPRLPNQVSRSLANPQGHRHSPGKRAPVSNRVQLKVM